VRLWTKRKREDHGRSFGGVIARIDRKPPLAGLIAGDGVEVHPPSARLVGLDVDVSHERTQPSRGSIAEQPFDASHDERLIRALGGGDPFEIERGARLGGGRRR
jgi:hypothetical protein